MKIHSDLYNIYGDLLATKDEDVTPDTVRRIREMGERHEQVRVPIGNTDIFADFEKVFADERYTTIFDAPVTNKDICAVASKLRIENDLIFELSNMKNNLPYTYRHILIVAALTIKLSLILKKNKYNEEIVTHCGFTHDIGKSRIPIAILNKETTLTKSELELLKTHPTLGFLLLNYYLKNDRVECSLASLEHHEKLDGSGYPNGTHKIGKYTQILIPVDIMDALMTPRPYRKKQFNLRTTLDYLIREATAKRLSMEAVKALISFARKDKPDISMLKVSTKPREALPSELLNERFK